MADDLDTIVANLQTRRATVAAQLAAMTSTSVGGKPNASGTDVNVDHVGYRQSLLQELADINAQLAILDPGIVISEGF